MTKTSKPAPAADPARKQAVIYARVSSKEQEKEGFSIPAQLKLLKEYAAAQGFAVVAGICGRGNRQADRPHRLRRDGRLSEGASVDPRDAGREDRPALPQPQGLGDGRRAGRRNPLPQGRRGAVAGVALLGKVHARHQGADGEELHRQPVGGSAQGDAGEGRAGHLADQDAARLSQRRWPGRQEDHRRRSGCRADRLEAVRVVRDRPIFAARSGAEGAGRGPHLSQERRQGAGEHCRIRSCATGSIPASSSGTAS